MSRPQTGKGWLLALSIVAISGAAHASEEMPIAIEAGPLSDALTSLSTQSGASIGMAGNLPSHRVKRLKGRMSVDAALRRLLAGSGLVAIRVGPNAWRIEKDAARPAVRHMRKAQPRSEKSAAPAPAAPPAAPVVIVVTAAKRNEPLDRTPIASTVIDGDAPLAFGVAPGAGDIAKLADSLTMTNFGPGRNRAFLRGIGDSPFNGQAQSTVATIFDHARVGFNAPEPELKLVDIDRIELLKGPQGPLYGTGALGGVFRIVTNRPDLDEFKGQVSGETGTLMPGGTAAAGSTMLNIPLSRGKVAMRLVGYKGSEAGWIDSGRPGGQNSNSESYKGGRLAFRWQANPDWTVDLGGVAQFLKVADGQYVDSPDRAYRRKAGLAEPHDNDFAHVQLAVTGRLGDVDLTAISGWTSHEVDSVFDASSAAATFNRRAPLVFNDDRIYKLSMHELRLSRQSGAVRWLVGASSMRARTSINAELGPGANAPAETVGRISETAHEAALFGEAGYEFAPFWTADLGVRIYRSRNATILASLDPNGIQTRHGGISPSLSLAYQPDPSHYYYARFASAVRPGGVSFAETGSAARYDSDELLSVELGGRWALDDKKAALKVEGYASQWSHLQAGYVLANGLIGTANNGTGTIYGIDATLEWSPASQWTIGIGGQVQHAKLESAQSGQAITGDLALPIVPSLRGHMSAGYHFDFHGWRGAALARARYSGAARLALDAPQYRPVEKQAEVDVALNIERSDWRLGISAENLLGNRAVTAGFGNPFSFASGNQRVLAAPRCIKFLVSKAF